MKNASENDKTSILNGRIDPVKGNCTFRLGGFTPVLLDGDSFPAHYLFEKSLS